MKRTPPAVRLASRIIAVVVGLAVLAVVGTQVAHVLGRNLALAHELRDVRADVTRLERERDRRLAQIRRLSDPSGAVPEIHEELRLIGDREAIVYLKGKPAETPAP